MRILHTMIRVRDLDASIAFYSGLFGQAPSVTNGDYAKWMLEDPRVNFAISTRGAQAGLDHLGFQVDDAAELAARGTTLLRLEVADLEPGFGGRLHAVLRPSRGELPARRVRRPESCRVPGPRM